MPRRSYQSDSAHQAQGKNSCLSCQESTLNAGLVTALFCAMAAMGSCTINNSKTSPFLKSTSEPTVQKLPYVFNYKTSKLSGVLY
jgi:hypothetical protein